MRSNLYTTVLGLSLCCSTGLWAQDESAGLQADVKGFVDSYHAVRSESPNDWMSSRSRVRGELTLSHGQAGAYLSANLIYNAVLPDKTGFALREAYLTHNTPHWDVRVGRQIVTWGVADGLRLTDVISPMDYSEFLAQDYDDIRIPVGGLRIRYGRERWNLDVVAVPVAEYFVLPTEANNPWSVGALPPIEQPRHRLYNMEYGARWSAYLSGMDLSISALHTSQKTPELYRGQLCYRRMGMVGGDLSVPIRQVVVRLEVASYLYDEGATHALLGLDWYMPGSCTLSAQYAHQLKRKGEVDVNTGRRGSRQSGLATLRLSKDLCHSQLNVQTFAYVDGTNGDVFDRTSADYALTDQIHLLIGYDILHADSGQFYLYRHNSEAWIKAKYSF